MHRMSSRWRGWAVLGLLWPLVGVGASPTGYALEELPSEDSSFALVPLGPGSSQDTARGERVAWARERTKEARSAYEELELGLAVARLDEALAALEEGGLEEGREELLAALALRALVHQGQGARSEAERWLRRLFVLEPRYEFAPEMMSHQFFELVARVRSETDAMPRAHWSIRTGAVSGLVYVDGRWRGVSPLDLKGETQGEHFITVRSPGFEPFSAQVQVEGSVVTEVTWVPLGRARVEEPPRVATGGPRRVWLYSAVGVSAVAGLTGMLLGHSTLTQLSRSGSIPMLEEQRYQQAQAAARRTALGANALYAVSLAAAGTAAWLFFMPEQRSSWSVQVSTVPGGMGATVRRSFK